MNQEQVQALQNENTQLKAEVYDLTRLNQTQTQMIEAVAKRVGFQGDSFEELLKALPEAEAPAAEPEVVVEEVTEE